MRIDGVAVFFAVVVTAGCSNRPADDGAQFSQRIRCSKVPEWQYPECMNGTRNADNENAK